MFYSLCITSMVYGILSFVFYGFKYVTGSNPKQDLWIVRKGTKRFLYSFISAFIFLSLDFSIGKIGLLDTIKLLLSLNLAYGVLKIMMLGFEFIHIYDLREMESKTKKILLTFSISIFPSLAFISVFN